MKIPRVVIAGLRGGGGKTTLSLGLAASLARRGLGVAPFKKGPDYIDAGWLARAAGVPCYNLDPFLIGEDSILRSFVSHARGAGIALVEGNRGLFDGVDAEGTYSTSALARMLKAPVVLVVDCTKRTRTTAAILAGVLGFERGLRIGGVVLNMVAGARHERITREAIERYTGVPVMGALPRMRGRGLPERHLGLVPTVEHPEAEGALDHLSSFVSAHVDLDSVVSLARSAPALADEQAQVVQSRRRSRVRIGVIRDTAFQFYYPENFEALAAEGADVVELSALDDPALPEVDALYIGGGFPETQAIALAGNTPLLRSVRAAAEDGLPIYAECGGLMYLGEGLVLEGRLYPMSGVLPLRFTMHRSPRAHGYTVARVTRKNPFFAVGTVLRGHEFHYSSAEAADGPPAYAFRMERGVGIADGRDAVLYRNVLATYTHLHALGSPEWARGMVRAARAFRRGRG